METRTNPRRLASVVEHRRSREQSGECLPRFSLNQKFSRPTFARGAALDDFRAMVAEKRRGRQLLDRSADRLFRGPSVEVLRELVPEDHNAFRVCRHDRLLHGVEQLRLESYRGFRARPLRHIRHGSDHPHWRADIVAGYVGAIQHVCVRAIRSLIAILIAPVGPAVIQHAVNPGDHPLPIFRMQVIVPPLYLGIDLVLLVPEYRLDRVVPDERVGLEVPVPDDVGRRFRHESKPLVGASHGALGFLRCSVMQIDHDCDGRYHASICVDNRGGAHSDKSVAAISPLNADLFTTDPFFCHYCPGERPLEGGIRSAIAVKSNPLVIAMEIGRRLERRAKDRGHLRVDRHETPRPGTSCYHHPDRHLLLHCVGERSLPARRRSWASCTARCDLRRWISDRTAEPGARYRVRGPSQSRAWLGASSAGTCAQDPCPSALMRENACMCPGTRQPEAHSEGPRRRIGHNEGFPPGDHTWQIVAFSGFQPVDASARWRRTARVEVLPLRLDQGNVITVAGTPSICAARR